MFYLAKLLKKLRIPSLNHCTIDRTAKVDSHCELTRVALGRYSYICSGSHITDAVIGAFCSIGRVSIGGGLHPMDTVSTSPVFLKGRNILGKNFADIGYEPSKTVTIGNDVWIGDGVYVKSGVFIGDGAVIGAHAVVTHDVAPYEIVAGVPAKSIRSRFPADTVKRLLELKWWDWPEDKLKRYAVGFDSPDRLFELLERGE